MRARGLLLLLLGAIVIGGCGGGGDEESNSKAATEQVETTTEAGQRQEGKEAPPQTPPEPNPPTATERTPGSRAVAPGVPTTKGGDNSIQAFGTEGQSEEAAQAAANLRAYLSARVAGDWAAACAVVSQEFRKQLEMLIERAKAKGAQKPEGCPETLELLFGKAASKALQEAAQVNRVLSFRVEESGYAYLIYEDAEGEIRFIAMANEDGAWKVNTIEPTGFPETEEQGSTQ